MNINNNNETVVLDTNINYNTNSSTNSAISVYNNKNGKKLNKKYNLL